MRVFIKWQRGGDAGTVDLDGHDSIHLVAQKVAAATGVHPSLQRLVFQGTVLDIEGGRTVHDHGIGIDDDLRLSASPGPRVIKLDVGGTLYTTTVETLRRIDQSKLARMFDGLEHQLEGGLSEAVPGGMSTVLVPRAADGTYIIDRDGPLFRHIINYLRSAPRERSLVDLVEPEPEPEPQQPEQEQAGAGRDAAADEEDSLSRTRSQLGRGISALEADLAGVIQKVPVLEAEQLVAAAARDFKEAGRLKQEIAAAQAVVATSTRRLDALKLAQDTVRKEEELGDQLPTQPDELCRLAREAEYYELPVLAAACWRRWQRLVGPPAAEISSLATLVAAAGQGVTVDTILGLSDADLRQLLSELSVNVVQRARIIKEVEAASAAVAAWPERRVDPSDGEAYTENEFQEAYGGLNEWNAAIPTRYKVVSKGVIREGADKKSRKTGELAIGEEILVLATEMVDGTLRVQFDRGWASVTAGSGKALLELVEQAESELDDEPVE